MTEYRMSPDEIVTSIERLLENWDEAAEPNQQGFHDGGGFALENWQLIRADLRWLLAHVDVLEAQ